MIVQVTNTGGDLGNNHFDLQIPGGGVGLFNGCSKQFPGTFNWGQQYGGVSTRADCNNIPAVLRAGCRWRFDWFMNADNPSISFRQVACPTALTNKTQCIRV
jgi:Glycosyl hydrolase family 45